MYQIVTETEDFVLIDKQPGYSVHKDQDDCSLTMQIRADRGYDALMPVHRLDKVTSGLMLFARNHAAASELSRAFSEHQVEKFYLALSDKKPRKKQGAVVGDMTRARRGAWKLAKTRVRPAVSQFFSYSLKPGVRLYVVRPLTGKTHQIRVALKSVGAPIIGDPLYHDASGESADRTYLHAYSLSFPFRGERLRFTCLPQTGELFDAECHQLIGEHCAEPWLLKWPDVQQHLPRSRV